MALPPVLQNLRIPVIGAPMFIVSNPDLVIAQCTSGIVGGFSALNAREEEVYEAVRSYGGITLHDIINNRFAKKAIEKGADGLIAVAAGAGGHAGITSPLALVQEIREWFDGPLVLSGCIARGDSVLAAEAMGADLGYVGSGFIATEEANAVDGYKEMIVESAADDIIYTDLLSGLHGSYLKGSVRNAGLDPDNLETSIASVLKAGEGSSTAPKWKSGSSRPKAWKDIWSAGQGVGAIKDVPAAAELVDRLEREYLAARERLGLSSDRA